MYFLCGWASLTIKTKSSNWLSWNVPNNFVAKSYFCCVYFCPFLPPHPPLPHSLSLSFLSFSPCPSLPFLIFLFSLFHAHWRAMATERSDKVRYIIYPCFTLYLVKMIQLLENWIYVLQFWAKSLLNHGADLKKSLQYACVQKERVHIDCIHKGCKQFLFKTTLLRFAILIPYLSLEVFSMLEASCLKIIWYFQSQSLDD